MPAAVLEPELDWAAGPGRSGGPEPFEDPELSALVAPAATPYLESVKQAVSYLHSGIQATRVFIARLLDLKLIEPIELEVEFDDGSRRDGVGLYTIDVGAFGALGDTTVVEFHRRGYLRLIDFMIASLKQLPVLASRKNARLLRGTETLARMHPSGHA